MPHGAIVLISSAVLSVPMRLDGASPMMTHLRPATPLLPRAARAPPRRGAAVGWGLATAVPKPSNSQDRVRRTREGQIRRQDGRRPSTAGTPHGNGCRRGKLHKPWWLARRTMGRRPWAEVGARLEPLRIASIATLRDSLAHRDTRTPGAPVAARGPSEAAPRPKMRSRRRA